MGRRAELCAVLLALFGNPAQASADQPSLALTQSGITRHFSSSELLARPDAASLEVVNDVSYGHPATYRAVPLLKLLSEFPSDEQSDTLEARATDGFVAQIPLRLVRAATTGGAVPWIAVEPPGHPWPNLPNMAQGPGPFYLVWEHPERSGVASEQWPYHLGSLKVVESPVHRWPQLALDPSLPADPSAQRGEAVFTTNCLPCHRLNGGGAGEMGPDLGRPMNVTDYMTDKGLRAIVREPQTVRNWPLRQMPGFSSDALPDSDLDALIAYLRQSRRAPPASGNSR